MSSSHNETQTDSVQMTVNSLDHCLACVAGIDPASSHCQFRCDSSRASQNASLKVHGKMLETTRNRERKRFNQLLARCSAQLAKSTLPWDSLQLSIQWAIRPTDVPTILKYWQSRSALHSAGLAALLGEKMYNRKRTSAGLTRSSKLSLTIWNLQGLMQAHMSKYQSQAVSTMQGWYYPPLVITAADVIPLSASELTVLHRRSCAKLAAFCVQTMDSTISKYREAMTPSTQLSESVAIDIVNPIN